LFTQLDKPAKVRVPRNYKRKSSSPAQYTIRYTPVPNPRAVYAEYAVYAVFAAKRIGRVEKGLPGTN
jgi:hypothetical protein